MKPVVAVLGSVNMDCVVRVTRPPRPGETVSAESLDYFPGGKGANQAVGAARLGSAVRLFAKVGDDPFGARLLQGLRDDGVDVEAVEVCARTPTGVALIWVDRQGENAIVIAAGANARVDLDYVERALPELARAEVVLLQLEIPWGSIAHLLAHLPPDRPRVILDPAPATGLPADAGPALKRVDLLTPNLVELGQLLGKPVTVDELGPALARLQVALGPRVICKAGEGGACWLDEAGRVRRLAAHRVQAVDATAAGDAFNAGLAVALAEGKALEEAVRFANAAGALTVTRVGAQPSLPDRAAVEALLE